MDSKIIFYNYNTDNINIFMFQFQAEKSIIITM